MVAAAARGGGTFLNSRPNGMRWAMESIGSKVGLDALTSDRPASLPLDRVVEAITAGMARALETQLNKPNPDDPGNPKGPGGPVTISGIRKAILIAGGRLELELQQDLAREGF
jgi:hypothetical protein